MPWEATWHYAKYEPQLHREIVFKVIVLPVILPLLLILFLQFLIRPFCGS
jgi:hypothetical protein